ncbi:MAG: flagellar motor switch protein FliG [bacterium]|nr:flagellar motor switch protein FliG [bacterium]
MTQEVVTTDSKKKDLPPLVGLDKAAALMLALSEDQAKRIFERMDELEVRELSQRMATLGMIHADSVEDLYMEFAESLASTGALTGNYESTERLLNKIFETDKVKSIMQEIRGPAGRTMWDKLSNVGADVLASYLKNEHPQTVAVILSKINTAHAGSVLAALPQEMSMEAISRMLNIEVVQQEVLSDVENTLKAEFMTNLSSSTQWDPYEVIADIFNSFDRSTEAAFMDRLEKKSPENAEKIKALMFTVNSHAKLSH